MGSSFSRSNLSPPSPNKIPQDNHDVFFNFTGEDTRFTFPCHLYAALTRLGIKTYMDYEIQRGDETSTTPFRTIEGAKVSIIIFSKNYASSKWCLDELVKIVECKSKIGQIVVPVFHHVDPSHVRNQTGSYGEAFAKHEQEFKDDKNRVLRWKESLATAASLSGWDCAVHRMEFELVEKIAQNVLQKLDSAYGCDLYSRIRTQRQMAQAKYDKYLSTSSQNDLEDIITALEQLILLKAEKVLKTNKESEWDDLGKTFELFVQLRKEKSKRTPEKNGWNDLMQHKVIFPNFERRETAE